MERYRNLLKPENRRYIPLAAFGLVRGLAAMAIRELAGTPKEIQERQAASIQFYSTGEEPQPGWDEREQRERETGIE